MPAASSVPGASSTPLLPLATLQKPACQEHGVDRKMFDEYHSWAADLAREACLSLDLYVLPRVCFPQLPDCTALAQAGEVLHNSTSSHQQIYLSKFHCIGGHWSL